MDIKKTFETMMGDDIDTIRNTIPAVKKSLIEKIKFRLVLITGSETQQFD